MRNASTLSAGLDVDKESITVASASEGRHVEPVLRGSIGTRQCDIDGPVR